VTDFLEEKRKEITDRLTELAPAVSEYHRLKAAVSALEGVGASSTSTAASAAAPRRRGPGRPRGSAGRTRKAAATSEPTAAATAAATTPAKAGRKKPGRPKGSGRKVGRPAGSRKKVGRPAGSGKKVGRPAGKAGRPKGKVGRRKGSGTRAAEALTFVQGQPGITIPELAAKMGIKQNYLYRVLPGLEQDGKLEKKGRGWHPKAA
jgi:hypothetical protein